jgi:hypothetical protein
MSCEETLLDSLSHQINFGDQTKSKDKLLKQSWQELGCSGKIRPALLSSTHPVRPFWVSSSWVVPSHIKSGLKRDSIENTCENVWARHESVGCCQVVKKILTEFPYCCSFPLPQGILFSFRAFGIFGLALLFQLPVCPRITSLQSHHTDGLPDCWQQKGSLAILIVQRKCLWVTGLSPWHFLL